MFTINDLKRIWFSLSEGEVNGPESPDLVDSFLERVNTEPGTGPQGSQGPQGPPGTPAYPVGTLIYRALLSQSGTNDPVVVELQSEGLSLTWVRTVEGRYTGTSLESMTNGKTFILIGSVNTVEPQAQAVAERSDDFTVVVQTYDPDQVGIVDGLLLNTAIEIIVFP